MFLNRHVNVKARVREASAATMTSQRHARYIRNGGDVEHLFGDGAPCAVDRSCINNSRLPPPGIALHLTRQGMLLAALTTASITLQKKVFTMFCLGYFLASVAQPPLSTEGMIMHLSVLLGFLRCISEDLLFDSIDFS